MLIDISSNVNACLVELLQNFFPSIYEKMKRANISIKGFDNTKNECIKYIFMPIEVGGKIVHQNVYIFQVKLPYNLLLGRCWIHKNRVITSTLHRSVDIKKCKFLVKWISCIEMHNSLFLT